MPPRQTLPHNHGLDNTKHSQRAITLDKNNEPGLGNTVGNAVQDNMMFFVLAAVFGIIIFGGGIWGYMSYRKTKKTAKQRTWLQSGRL